MHLLIVYSRGQSHSFAFLTRLQPKPPSSHQFVAQTSLKPSVDRKLPSICFVSDDFLLPPFCLLSVLPSLQNVASKCKSRRRSRTPATICVLAPPTPIAHDIQMPHSHSLLDLRVDRPFSLIDGHDDPFSLNPVDRNFALCFSMWLSSLQPLSLKFHMQSYLRLVTWRCLRGNHKIQSLSPISMRCARGRTLQDVLSKPPKTSCRSPRNLSLQLRVIWNGGPPPRDLLNYTSRRPHREL